VAQQTAGSQEPGVYYDDVDPGVGSIRNKAERRRMMKRVYGDSWWVDPVRIEREIEALLMRDPAQAERFFLNRKMAAEGAAFDYARWEALVDATHVVPDKARVVIGIDGARFDDALAIVATEVATGYQFVVGIWERPELADDEYEHPADEVDGAVSEAFERFDVWRAYADPQYIEHLVTKWQGRWGEKRVIGWFTNRPKQTAYALRAYRSAMQAGDLSHDGSALMARHIANARRRNLPGVYDEDRRPMWTVSKDAPGSPRKIDAAMAGALSWEARSDAIAAGAGERRVSVYEARGLTTL
jgi:hypothetical protein